MTKKKIIANITDYDRCKYPHQNTYKLNPTKQRIINHAQMGLILGMQGLFNIHKVITVIHNINKLKNKNHMINSIDEDKAFDEIQDPFMIKNFPGSGHRGTLL